MTYREDDYLQTVLGHNRNSLTKPIPGFGNNILYASGGLFAKVIDYPADAAVSKGVEIEGDIDALISNEIDRLKVMAVIADCLRWSRLYGGAAMIIIADDGADLSKPLSLERLQQIHELKVFDLNDISASHLVYSDPTKTNYGMPQYYEVTPRFSGFNARFKVHESRLIEFGGDPLPREMITDNIPWKGRSVASGVYPAICSYQEVLLLCKEVLRRKQQAVHKMKGLAASIAARGSDAERAMQMRINMVDIARGIRNSVAVDTEDDYTIINCDVAGLPALVQEEQINVSACSGISVVRLFGRPPGGLNSSGNTDIENDNAMVDSVRVNRAQPPLERLISLICAQNTIKDKAPQDWKIKWPALRQLTEKEEAEIEKIKAEARKTDMDGLLTAMQATGLSEEESRQYIEELGIFGMKAQDGNATAATRYASQT